MLNIEARNLRIHHGAVNPSHAVALRDGTRASVGDWIVSRRNNRRLTIFGGKDWVTNGDTWHVLSLGSDGSLDVTHRAHGGRAHLPADYVSVHTEVLLIFRRVDLLRSVSESEGIGVYES